MKDNSNNHKTRIEFLLTEFSKAVTQILDTSMPKDDATVYFSGISEAIKLVEKDPSNTNFLIAISFIKMLHQLAEERKLADSNYTMATKDKTTGLDNRNTLQATYERFSQRIQEGKLAAATLILADGNEFKTINDYFGHPVGDEALTAYANILKSVVPKSDYVARVGGDEFLIRHC